MVKPFAGASQAVANHSVLLPLWVSAFPPAQDRGVTIQRQIFWEVKNARSASARSK